MRTMEIAYEYAVPAMPPGEPLANIVRHALRDAEDSVAATDSRWSAIIEYLEMLHAAGRRSVRIVDAACGAGALLLPAARRARALGFVAIEARGVDADTGLLARARRAAAAIADRAIDVQFDLGAVEPTLREEAAFPADILLYAADLSDMAHLAPLARRAAQIALVAPVRASAR